MHPEIQELLDRAIVLHRNGESLDAVERALRELCFVRHPELADEFDTAILETEALRWGNKSCFENG